MNPNQHATRVTIYWPTGQVTKTKCDGLRSVLIDRAGSPIPLALPAIITQEPVRLDMELSNVNFGHHGELSKPTIAGQTVPAGVGMMFDPRCVLYLPDTNQVLYDPLTTGRACFADAVALFEDWFTEHPEWPSVLEL